MATTEEVHPVRDKDSASNGVKKLAALARIKIADAELEKFTKEFDAIIAYVSQLAKTVGDGSPDAAAASREKLYNVMREDGEPHTTGTYTEKIVAQFPAKEGNALSVKQIITHE